MSIPKRVTDRFQQTVRRYQQVLEAQRARDVSEADTVTIVKDMLTDVFGYDKYAELTSEYSIRCTYCDLAVKLDNKLAFLIEVKAIGLELKDSHIKQAIDYAANQGCEWVVLTNAVEWRLYHVLFQKPIEKQEIAELSVLAMNPRNASDLEKLYLLTREGFTKNALAEYRDKKDATSRFLLAAILTRSESVVSAVRREVRRISGLIVEQEVIERILRDEVIKRECLEGDQAHSAGKRFNRGSDKSLRRSNADDSATPASESPVAVVVPAP